MTSTVKWVALGFVFAILSIFLYMNIDSDWTNRNNASIWVTIVFFASATVTILCGFNAIESKDQTSEH